MNFLSHYYFDIDTTNCYVVLGTVLPDLLKNADKKIILHPGKLQHNDNNVNMITRGWNRHLLVDRHFHSSEFFIYHAHQLKKQLMPALAGSPVKPFFLGHVALELILDNLLLINNIVNIDSFYSQLDSCSQPVIEDFLTSAGLADTASFFKFYNAFKQSRYLESYFKLDSVGYALKKICQRIWIEPFTRQQELKLISILTGYRKLLADNYLDVFKEISLKLLA